MKLPKFFQLKILIIVNYLKNQSPGIDGITSFQQLKRKKLNLCHLKIVGSRAWVYVVKKMRQKLDEKSWQKIFIGQTGENQYEIFNPRTEKLHVARDTKIDEYNFYNKLAANFWDLVYEDQSSNSNFKFTTFNKFEDELNQPYSQKKNTLQSQKGKKILELTKKENAVDNLANNNNLAISFVPNNIDFLSDKLSPSTLTQHS